MGWVIKSGIDALRVDKSRRVRDMLIGGFFVVHHKAQRTRRNHGHQWFERKSGLAIELGFNHKPLGVEMLCS